MLDQIGGRKMAVSVVTVLICVGVVVYKGDVPSGLADMLKFVLGSFILGNVGSQVAGVVGDHVAAKQAAPEAAPAQPDPRIDAVLAQQDALIKTAQASQQGIAFIAERIATRG